MTKADVSLKEKKAAFFARCRSYLSEYNKVVIVGADNVGSSQMQNVRKALRGHGALLMGKNTMMRKVIRGQMKENPALEKLIPLITGNVGLLFTNGDPAIARKVINEHKVGAPARPGTIAPDDVTVPPGPTGMEPTQTSFFQALNIATKIVKGQIEIVQEVKLITKGQKVGNSESVLLQKLDIKPFAYALTIQAVYDNGAVYEAKVLDLSDSDILAKFQLGMSNVKAISVATGSASIVAVPFALSSAYANILAVSLEADYSFKGNQAIKAYLANPSAFSAAASAAPAAAAPAAGGKAAPAAKVEEKKEEEEDGDMGLGLFD